MKPRAKISFATKWLSNKHYVNEVPVEGKRSPDFLKKWWFFDSYQQQVIRSGNCLTLLSSNDPITARTFWNLHHLEHNCRYVFFTFSKSFLTTLVNNIHHLQQYQIERAIELFNENPAAYSDLRNIDDDEELQFCMLKLNSIRQSPKYDRMFKLDQSNRKALLEALLQKISPIPSGPPEPSISSSDPVIPPFQEILKALPGKNSADIINFMKLKIQEAGFEYDLFSKIKKVGKGRNPYKLNYQIAAMLDFFSEKKYFLHQYSRKEIFEAYLEYTGNSIGKFETFLSQCYKDSNYRNYKSKLNALNISDLQ